MVDVILRDVKSTKAYDGNTPILTQKDAEEIVREHLSKRLGKRYNGNIDVSAIRKRVQVSLNSDMHLVVRVFPEIEYSYTTEDGKGVIISRLTVQDTDTVVVFDAQETREILRFVKENISLY